VLVAGCAFDHGTPQGGGIDEPADDPTGETGSGSGGSTAPDAGTVTQPVLPCKYSDPALRLCIEFEDQKYTPQLSDASTYQHQVSADDLVAWSRGGTPAAAASLSFWNTDVQVPEHAMLDISGPLTFELWLEIPPVGASYAVGTVLGNANQYSLAIDSSGRATCRIGNSTAQSDVLGKGVWRHIACTFTNNKVAIHIDGAAVRCQSAASTVPTSGTSGTRIMRGYPGAIDDIHVYARKLSGSEICTHANKSTCSPACDDD
jgi:hypothetical protein